MAIRLQRITTAVPWPRGIVFRQGVLVVLARGRGRGAGGPDPSVPDAAGSLFAVDPTIWEWVDQNPTQAGTLVANNALLLAAPTEPPFKLWDFTASPATEDIETDRPYATLKWDPISTSYFIGGFSGIDAAPNGARFRKNATDALHRYDPVTSTWYSVESHDPLVVPEQIRKTLRSTIPNQYFPHSADPIQDPAPHGWLNGPDGLCVFDEYLYAVGKDNHRLVMYPLTDIQADTSAGPPVGEVLLEGTTVPREGGGSDLVIDGYSAVGVSHGYLYLGCRTNNVVVRFGIDSDGRLSDPVEGGLVASFAAGSNLIDLDFNSSGELFVSTASDGNVWNCGNPDPQNPFYGPQAQPFLELRTLTSHSPAKAVNIALDWNDELYVTTNNNDDPAGAPELPGSVYRAVEV